MADILKHYPDTEQGHMDWTFDTMEAQMNGGFRALVSQFKTGKMMVWNNPKGLHPQKVMDTHGTGASRLFQISGVIGNAINTLIPGTVDVSIPAGYSVTFNPDGTVTITGEPA